MIIITGTFLITRTMMFVIHIKHVELFVGDLKRPDEIRFREGDLVLQVHRTAHGSERSHRVGQVVGQPHQECAGLDSHQLHPK